MAKDSYIGINNTAHNIREAYIGINNIARKIDEIYFGDNNIAKQIYSKQVLSDTYQQVEYIENTSSSYINLGIGPKKNSTRIEVIAKFNSLTDTGNPHLFGCQDSSNTNRFKVYTTSASKIGVGFGSVTSTFDLTVSTDYIYHIILDIKKLFASINIYPNGTPSTINLTDSTPSSKNIWIFCQNNNGSQGNACKVNIYSFKLYEDNIIKKNLYPCYNKDTNVIGMFDIANDSFLIGSGSGTFNKGYNTKQIL